MQPTKAVLGRRVPAFLIDIVVVWVPVAVLCVAIAKTGPPGTAQSSSSFYAQLTSNDTQHYVAGGQMALLVALLAFDVLVTFVWLPARTGASPGMGLLGLRVVGDDGGRVRLGRHLARTALWIADGFPYIVPGALAFVIAATNSRRQRLGDLVAHTQVVRARS